MGDLARFLPGWTSLLFIPGLIAGFTVHELAHACVAYWLGDASQVARHRLSLNPLRHIFWLGAVTFIFFGFGWARPVRMDLSSFRRRYLGLLIVSLMGAVANLALAVLAAGLTLAMVLVVSLFSRADVFEVLRLVAMELPADPDLLAWTAAFTTYAVYVNLALAFFNLLPLPGLDGFNVLIALYGLAKDPSAGASAAVARRSPLDQPVTAEEAPRPAEIHFQVGRDYHAQGDYADAIARYRQAIASDQHFGPAYVNLGLAYLASGQRERAIQAWRGATQFAADEDSRREAWAQLHRLSQFSPAALDSGGNGVADVAPEPVAWANNGLPFRWSTFWGKAALVAAGSACLYIGLTLALIFHFS
jgi:Zn-dependent protease